MRICLDPAYGGETTKLVGTVPEGEINLSLARRIGAALEKAGHQAVFTRTEDGPVPFAARVAFANRSGAKLLVSLQAGYDRDPTVGGTEVYCFRRGGRGERLAAAIQGAIVAALGTEDRGVKEGYRVYGGRRPIYILAHTKMPAVRVAAVYRSHPGEAALLASLAGQEKIARAVAAGVLLYLGGKKP